MSYFWFNRQKLLEKAKYKYHNGSSKEKAVEYYFKNREDLKEKTKNKYRSFSEEEKKQKENMNKIDIKNERKCQLKEC